MTKRPRSQKTGSALHGGRWKVVVGMGPRAEPRFPEGVCQRYRCKCGGALSHRIVHTRNGAKPVLTCRECGDWPDVIHHAADERAYHDARVRRDGRGLEREAGLPEPGNEARRPGEEDWWM